ncbi:MAG: sugar phosphate isomerase/epimerase [Deltaproteobacteria bacterium]|jgi:sugar phosphate isomerase/epimerase|nr:sugar phosphate isomerase/epimerase [Deltaproteobacteria bacterium]
MLIGCTAETNELDLVANAGYDYVELGAKNVRQLDQRGRADLARQLEKLRLPCLYFNRYCPPEVIIAGPGFDEKNVGQYARDCLSAALTLGVQGVGIGSPLSRRLPAGFDPRLALKQFRSFLRVTTDILGQKDITVCVEALGLCYCNCVNYVEEAAALARELDSPHLGLVIDFYNMEFNGEGDLDLTGYLPLIRHAHISDDQGRPDQRAPLIKERRHIHLRRLRRLKEAGYDISVSLEVDLPVVLETAKENLRFLREACG